MILARLLAPLRRRQLHAAQARRIAQLAAVPRTPGRVVFLGDSITEWAAWEDWFPDLRTANRGVAGQGIAELAARLDTALTDPRAIVLLIGTNDLPPPQRPCDVEALAGRMGDLVARIRTLAPAAPLLVSGILPRSAGFRDRIRALNTAWQAIAADAGADYVDPWPALADASGAIRPDYSYDALHLTAEGYRAWIETLRPWLTQFAEPA